MEETRSCSRSISSSFQVSILFQQFYLWYQVKQLVALLVAVVIHLYTNVAQLRKTKRYFKQENFMKTLKNDWLSIALPSYHFLWSIVLFGAQVLCLDNELLNVAVYLCLISRNLALPTSGIRQEPFLIEKRSLTNISGCCLVWVPLSLLQKTFYQMIHQSTDGDPIARTTSLHFLLGSRLADRRINLRGYAFPYVFPQQDNIKQTALLSSCKHCTLFALISFPGTPQQFLVYSALGLRHGAALSTGWSRSIVQLHALTI